MHVPISLAEEYTKKYSLWLNRTTEYMNNILYLHEISFSVVQNFVLFLLIRFHGFLFLTEVERESYHKIKRVYIYFDSDFSVVVR